MRRIAARASPLITSTRMSFPFDSAMKRWIRMSSPRLQMVSSIDSTEALLSAKITPVPCVPRSSLRMSGGPPTSFIILSRSRGYREISVSGTGTPFRASSWRQLSLFFACSIADARFTTGTSISSKWRTTAIE